MAQPDRLVEVPRINQEIARQLFPRLDEWPVGHKWLARPAPGRWLAVAAGCNGEALKYWRVGMELMCEFDGFIEQRADASLR